MRQLTISFPELGLVAGTRAVAGLGLGLLLAGQLSNEARRALGWGLFLFGAVATIPLALDVLGRSHALMEGHWKDWERSPAHRGEPVANEGRSTYGET